VRAALSTATAALRRRWRRTILSAVGIVLAAAMLAAALVVGEGLGGGFDRAAAAADLPDVIVRFDPQSPGAVAKRIAALPDVRAFSLRDEVTNVPIEANGHSDQSASVEIVGTGPRGYAVVAGRQMSSTRFGEVVVERGLAQAWGIGLGSRLYVAGLGPLRVVGLAEAPDNVSYPLAVPRIYLSESALAARFGVAPGTPVDQAEIWLRDPRFLDEVLVQARTISYGVHGLRFVTRAGAKVLLDQAAGIVIDLLVALSLIALATASVMLAASARAEVQRRLGSIGVRRALGASRGHVAGAQALEAALVAAPAALLGTAAGTLSTYAPAGRLLTMLNEAPAGGGLILPLAGCLAVSVAIPVLAAAWPAWRAAGRPPVALLGGVELTRRRGKGSRRAFGRGGRTGSPAGVAVLGARLVAARRSRLAATALMLGVSTAFVLLLLSLASALQTLETDPGALGERYQLTAQLPPSSVREVRALPGVQAVAPRYEVQAADSFNLGETIDVIAYPGDHTVFEAPPLTDGRRLHAPDEAEVGAGLADALGLSPGSTLALAFTSGTELRLRVAGVVSSLDHDGRVAYIPARALLAAMPSAPEQLAVRLSPGADSALVSARLEALGGEPQATGGATDRGQALVAVLRTLLRAVAIVDGLVCLYALVQACTLTTAERRGTIAVLRAGGAGAMAVRALLSGAVVAMVVPAAVLGVLLELFVMGPTLSHLAAAYASLSLVAGPGQIAGVLAGLAAAALGAVMLVARQIGSEPVIAGLDTP